MPLSTPHPEEDVDTEAELEQIIGPPFQPSMEKEIDHIDQICVDYIAKSPFLVIASQDASGKSEISPRGDICGFVSVLDKHHLALPERPGNRRSDTLRRILRNPNVAMLFLIPGMGETLRVYGQARITKSASLRESLAVDGKAPAVVVIVRVERAMIHCPKCAIRSGLWAPGTWPKTDDLPTIGPVMKVHADLQAPQAVLDEDARRAGMFDLY